MNSEEKNKLKTFIQAHENEEEVIEKLDTIDTEIDLEGGTPLNHAANYDRNNVIEFLIKKGANVNSSHKGFTALISACERNNKELVKILIEAGADIEMKDNFDNNALWKATFNENKEIIELLIKHGADPFSISKNGKTIYERANRMNKKIAIAVFDAIKK